jgi:hypothetical protein
MNFALSGAGALRLRWLAHRSRWAATAAPRGSADRTYPQVARHQVLLPLLF